MLPTLLQEGRWPGTLTLQLRFWGGGADNARFYTRSTAFPAPSLAGKPPPPRPAGSAAPAGAADGSRATSGGPAQAAPAARADNTSTAGPAAVAPFSNNSAAPSPDASLLAHLAEHRASGRAVGAPHQDALEAALRANAEGLCRSSSSLQPPAAVLVEVLAAHGGNFASCVGHTQLPQRCACTRL